MPLPKPLRREKENDFIGRCVPLVINLEGLDKDDDEERAQAIAICYSQWRKAKGGKAMEIDDLKGVVFDVDGEDVSFVDLVEAYKARADVQGEGAREKARDAQKKRSQKYGIAVLKVGNVTKPAEWDSLSDAEFADPVNYRYPIHDEGHVRNAAARFAQEDVTYKGRSVVEERIDKARRKFKIGEYREEEGGKALSHLEEGYPGPGKAIELQQRLSQIADAWRAEFARPTVPGGEKPWYNVRVFEDPDVCTVELSEGLYAYPYTVDGDGVTFDEPYEVEFVIQRKKESKSVDVEAHLSRVRDAWRAEFARPTVPGGEKPWYDVRIFEDPDLVVVKLPEGLYAYPFSEDDEGGIIFDEPYEVEFVIQRKEGKAIRSADTSTALSTSFGVRNEDEDVRDSGEDAMIALGGEIKALGNGWIGGYVVRFGNEVEKDLVGQWFTPGTYLGPADGNGADVMVHHGLPLPHGIVDPAVKAELDRLSQRLLHPVETKRDAVGIFGKTLLNMADEYERMLESMVEQQKLRWSSGTAARVMRTKSSGEIERWPIVEASLTPMACEFRGTQVMPLKAYMKAIGLSEGQTGGAAAGAAGLEAAQIRARAQLALLEIEQEI